MPVIGVLSSKGGVGKSTILSALAVVASKAGALVRLVDADPQQSVATWWRLRKTENPALADANILKGKTATKLGPDDWLFIDTPNAQLAQQRNVIDMADVIVTVMKPGAFDLASIVETERIIREQRAQRKVIRVLNDYEPKQPFHNEVLGHLTGQHGERPFIVQHRAVYGAATATGSSAVESNRQARDEITALWEAIQLKVLQ